MEMPEWASEPMALAETKEWKMRQEEEEARRSLKGRLSERFSLRLKKWGVPHVTGDFVWADERVPDRGVSLTVDGIGFSLPLSHAGDDRTGLVLTHEALSSENDEGEPELYCQSMTDFGNALRVIAAYVPKEETP